MAFFIFSQPLIAWRASLGTPRPSTPIVPASARVAGPWQRSMGDESGVFNSRAEYLLKLDLTTAVQDVLAMVTSEKVATQPWRNVLNSHTTNRPWDLGGGVNRIVDCLHTRSTARGWVCALGMRDLFVKGDGLHLQVTISRPLAASKKDTEAEACKAFLGHLLVIGVERVHICVKHFMRGHDSIADIRERAGRWNSYLLGRTAQPPPAFGSAATAAAAAASAASAPPPQSVAPEANPPTAAAAAAPPRQPTPQPPLPEANPPTAAAAAASAASAPPPPQSVAPAANPPNPPTAAAAAAPPQPTEKRCPPPQGPPLQSVAPKANPSTAAAAAASAASAPPPPAFGGAATAAAAAASAASAPPAKHAPPAMLAMLQANPPTAAAAAAPPQRPTPQPPPPPGPPPQSVAPEANPPNPPTEATTCECCNRPPAWHGDPTGTLPLARCASCGLTPSYHYPQCCPWAIPRPKPARQGQQQMHHQAPQAAVGAQQEQQLQLLLFQWGHMQQQQQQQQEQQQQQLLQDQHWEQVQQQQLLLF